MTKEINYFNMILVIFCVIGYSISITCTQLNLLEFGTPTFMILYSLSGYSPVIAALITKNYLGINNEFEKFIKSIISIKQNFIMYLYILIAPMIVWIVPFFIFRLNRGTGSVLKHPIHTLLWIIPLMIIGGGLEEIGWRGLLLPELLKKYSETVSSVITGVVWSCWHIPMWFVVGSSQQSLNFGTFTVSCISTSFLLTVVYIKTKSIWLCILLHAVDNACFYIFKYSVYENYLYAISSLAISIVIFYISKQYIKPHIKQ